MAAQLVPRLPAPAVDRRRPAATTRPALGGTAGQGTHSPATAHLPYEPQSVGAARRLVRGALREWQLPDLVEAGELLASELAGNAVKTGCGWRMTVAIEHLTDRCVRISVRDGYRSLPCLIEVGSGAEPGRGLALVHQLTGGHWGATAQAFGKTVHAECALLCGEGPGGVEGRRYRDRSRRSEASGPLRRRPGHRWLTHRGCSFSTYLFEHGSRRTDS
ncbi:hypothetical protein ABH930_006736 [Kitasatospora sp. GAS204A]|nr:hypothetical protein [Kitasatospora sp. GAS204B]